ncbi:ABC transporter permease [Paenibacillus sp. NFR01]|uniref:ABC transporter permease n=1 Tax=Paenibacillus sp. NFR01 TaxID=1566279 RepID=UPI0008C1999A|nr:ABC transporter permease [Paenibacillus sp. NFR01]SET06805.1 sulfonate transport system permease protein [Paenibacillus sp. NFR01]
MSVQTLPDGALAGPAEKPVALARKSPRRRGGRLVRGSVLPLLVLGVWQFLSMHQYADPALFPAPSSIASELYNMIRSGELLTHLRVSILRALFGFLLGGSIGLIAGLLVGMFNKAEEYIDPTVQMLRAIPLLAITPLFILWFGYGELSKILLISLGAFFPLYINTFLGVRNVDAKLFDVAKVLEFSRTQQMLKLVLPSAMPNFLLGLRLSISFSWMVLVVAELMGAEQGIGYLIQDARSFMRTEVVFIGILIFALVGKLSDSLVRLLEYRLLKWQDTYKG